MELPDEIRVLVVDDHPVVRMGLGSMLGSQKGIKVVGMVASGGEALTSLPRVRPDVVLMDLRMPEMDGVDAIVALRAAEPNVKILVRPTIKWMRTYSTPSGWRPGYLVKRPPGGCYQRDSYRDPGKRLHSTGNRCQAGGTN